MSTNVGSVTSHFPSAENGFTTTTSGSVASGAVTVGLNSVAGYANGEVVVLVIDPTDPDKKQTFTGIMDTAGSQVTNVAWTAGNNQLHALGATVVDYATATHISMMTKGILVEHNQDGSHKNSLVAMLGGVQTFTGNKTFSGTVTLPNGTVGPSNLATGAASANVDTAETTAAQTYTDLTTTTDTVTVTIGANRLALVILQCYLQVNAVDSQAWCSFAVSGASTIAASDTRAVMNQSYGTSKPIQASSVILLTATDGLNTGSNTFKMKYRVNANTGSFQNRRIAVIPL